MPESRKPEDSPFKQQRLKAWQPILTPKWVIGTFALVGLIFVPIGIILKKASDDVVEYSIQYDGEGTAATVDPACRVGDTSSGVCTLTFDIKEDMDGPVYVYYELENFYQNHRRYVKSRSDSQLRGEELADDELSDCSPVKTKVDADGIEKILSPCGLIANSYFNDIITVQGPVVMDENEISWKSDREDKFENPPSFATAEGRETYIFLDETYGLTEGVEDEHFIVWMRTAGLPDFRKLYGKIHAGLKKGDEVKIDIDSNFEVMSFKGKKSIVLSTTSWFGGKNPFLGIAYITVGTLCLFLSALFLAKHIISPRPLGDTRYLVWKNRQ